MHLKRMCAYTLCAMHYTQYYTHIVHYLPWTVNINLGLLRFTASMRFSFILPSKVVSLAMKSFILFWMRISTFQFKTLGYFPMVCAMCVKVYHVQSSSFFDESNCSTENLMFLWQIRYDQIYTSSSFQLFFFTLYPNVMKLGAHCTDSKTHVQLTFIFTYNLYNHQKHLHLHLYLCIYMKYSI